MHAGTVHKDACVRKNVFRCDRHRRVQREPSPPHLIQRGQQDEHLDGRRGDRPPARAPFIQRHAASQRDSQHAHLFLRRCKLRIQRGAKLLPGHIQYSNTRSVRFVASRFTFTPSGRDIVGMICPH